jgi:hypothetical protein
LPGSHNKFEIHVTPGVFGIYKLNSLSTSDQSEDESFIHISFNF